MAELSKDEIQADAILDAATPPAATESSFPEFPQKKKAAPRKAPVKKSAVKKAEAVEEAMPTTPTVSLDEVKPKVASSTSNDLVKKSWKRINSWGLGISGKVIILLIVIGIFSEIVRRF